MKYLLLMTDHGAEPEPGEPAAGPECLSWEAAVDARGIDHHGARLRPPSEAVTVRVRDGERLVTDGPFADTKEQVCGFEVMDCPDLDAAIEVAAIHPVATPYAVEIRPFWELP
jgi:hypothetical protein